MTTGDNGKLQFGIMASIVVFVVLPAWALLELVRQEDKRTKRKKTFWKKKGIKWNGRK